VATQNYLGNGVYRVSYVPSAIGTLVISVLHQGVTPIANSPFTLNVQITGTSSAYSFFVCFVCLCCFSNDC
jgi:hypothetical protein